MSDITRQFFDLMVSHGCQPHHENDLIADDQRHRISCAFDKKGEKTITYQLKVDRDIGIGWFHSFKFGQAGETVKFFTRPQKSYTQEEKTLFLAGMKRAKKLAQEREKKRWQRQKRMALRLTKIYENSTNVEKHPYLAAKKINASTKVRAKGNQLLIPAYQPDGLIWSLQTINSRGFKLFTLGGMLSGGFFELSPIEGATTIIITEGYATACSIQKQTDIPIVVAFSAGNLLKVASHIAERNKASIIIAADNDRFTKNAKGEFYNTGIIKATIAADAVGGRIIYPKFPKDDKTNGTDWNDYINEYGPEQLIEALGSEKQLNAAREGEGSFDVVSLVASPLPTSSGNAWRTHLSTDKDGVPVKSSLRNAILYLQHHPDYEGVFKLNEFHKEIYIARCPLWSEESEFHIKRLDDYEIACCAAHLEEHGIVIDLRKTLTAIMVAAEHAKFHPAREYFESIVWDKTPRLDSWLAYYLGAEGDEAAYLSFIGKKWLTAAVKRVFQPGCKFDHVLVIEGLQGKGKSTALEYLATFGKEKAETYFTDNIRIADIQNKDTILLLQGSIIVELAELAGFNKRDDEEIKGWVTLKKDRCRKPYDKTITEFPRQFVLSATTNNHEYLKDPTGNRRYWPFKSSALDLAAIKRDREQLWAEAMHYYREGLYIGPTEEEMLLAEAAQEKRRSIDVWEDEVLQMAHDADPMNKNGVTVKRLLDRLGFSLRDQDQKAMRRVSSILQQNGYRNEVRWFDNKAHRVWIKS